MPSPGVRYWVMVSDDLMDAQPQWPSTLRPVERGGIIQPGMRWWLFEDDDAPADLDGKEVELNLLSSGAVVIVERTVMAGQSTATIPNRQTER
jgi:hypothetical protein